MVALSNCCVNRRSEEGCRVSTTTCFSAPVWPRLSVADAGLRAARETKEEGEYGDIELRTLGHHQSSSQYVDNELYGTSSEVKKFCSSPSRAQSRPDLARSFLVTRSVRGTPSAGPSVKNVGTLSSPHTPSVPEPSIPRRPATQTKPSLSPHGTAFY